MKKQYIELLNRQIGKLEDEAFDLEAWKSSTLAVLTKVFGSLDPKIKQIDQLKIDYSSWALRDSNANYRPIETAMKKGREILRTAIDEIEIFGAGEDNATDIIGKKLSEELKTMTEAEKEKHFKAMKKEQLVELLMGLTS